MRQKNNGVRNWCAQQENDCNLMGAKKRNKKVSEGRFPILLLKIIIRSHPIQFRSIIKLK